MTNAFPPPERRRPRRAADLTRWVAGPEGTPDNHGQRVTLNGEPVPTAVEADAEGDAYGPYVVALLPEDALGGVMTRRKLRGRVAIVAGDR